MPELPEVETITRFLRRELTGRTIKSVEIIDNKVLRQDSLPTEVVVGQKICSVSRRGKSFALITDQYALVFHLKMTGQIIITGANKRPVMGGHPTDDMRHTERLPSKATRLLMVFDHNRQLFFNDQRRFGWIRVLPAIDLDNDKFVRSLGPEFDSDEFSPAYLTKRIKASRRYIKSLLLDQNLVAGIGNIYFNKLIK